MRGLNSLVGLSGLIHNPGVGVAVSLATLIYTGDPISENANQGDAFGTLSVDGTGTWTYSLLEDDGGRVALVGNELRRGATALNYATHPTLGFRVQAIRAEDDATLEEVFSEDVINEATVTLQTLSPDNISYVAGSAENTFVCALLNWTEGSTITVDDTRLKISGRNVLVGPTAQAAATTFLATFTETLAGATNTPKTTARTITVTAAPVANPAHVASVFAEGNTLTMPAFQTGDVLVFAAYRDGSATPPTIPAAISGHANWVQKFAGQPGTLSQSAVYGTIVSTTGAETFGTWTNASSVSVQVYRNVAVGAFGAVLEGTSVTINHPAVTLQVTDGTSWVTSAAMHRQSDTGLEVPRTGMVRRAGGPIVTPSSEHQCFDTNGGVATWAAENQNIGGSGGGSVAFALELKTSGAPGDGGDGETTPPDDTGITGAGYTRAGFTALRTVNVSTQAELETALGSALPGDDIVLANGTYSGNINLTTNKGTLANPVRIRAANEHLAIISPASTASDTIGVGGSAYWIFQDLKIVSPFNASKNSFHIRATGIGSPSFSPAQFTLFDNLLWDGAVGDMLKVSKARDITINDCTFRNFSGSSEGGIDVVGCKNIRITNNTMTDMTWMGLNMKAGTENILVEGNTFTNINKSAMEVGGNSSNNTNVFWPGEYVEPDQPGYTIKNAVVRNNTVNGAEVGMKIIAAWDALIENNTILACDPNKNVIIQDNTSSFPTTFFCDNVTIDILQVDTASWKSQTTAATTISITNVDTTYP